jgi:hypothetical protein
MILRIDVEIYQPSRIRVIVEDADQENTVFTDRFEDIQGGQHTFKIRLPLVGERVNVFVFNEENGDIDNDDSFQITNISKEHLIKRLDLIDLRNVALKNFILFAQRFSYNAGNLPTNNPSDNSSCYVSDCNNYVIKYVDVITDENGTPIPTPASILASVDEQGTPIPYYPPQINTNIAIDCCSQQFRGYTVPMRMAILLHEFAHYYLNENPEDETEADLNGLMIYLSLGYPRVEAYEAWIDTFWDVDTEENCERFQIIQKFIEDFETNKILINTRF